MGFPRGKYGISSWLITFLPSLEAIDVVVVEM